MSDPNAARAFLQAEIETLEPFGFVIAGPSGNPFHIVEVGRREDASLEVRVPGRPPIAPELPVATRAALRERGFASEDAADPGKPWVRGVPDAEAAVLLVQRVLAEVFEEKPDVPIDVIHGSRKDEHEAELKLAEVRGNVERILTQLLKKAPTRDEDGDYVLPVQDVHVTVAPRVGLRGVVVVRVFAITNLGVTVAPELGLFLARLNFGLMFGRFALDAENRSIWFDETLLGDHFTDEELRFVVQVVATTADEWDDRLKQMFGGVTYQEARRAQEHPGQGAPKPGHGGYL